MIKTRPLIVSGSISLDRIMNFKGSYKDLIQTDKLHVLSISVLLDQLTHSRGGVAANICYSLALLGNNPTLLGSIGTDALDYLADLQKLGVDTSHTYISNLPTATFTVMTDQDDNQIGGFYPGAMSDANSLNLDPWQGSNAIVVISPGDPSLMSRLTDQARALQLELVYDIGQQVSNCNKPDLLAGVNAAKVLLVNDYELRVLSTRTDLTPANIKKQIPLVITTLGKDGCLIEGKSIEEPIKVSAVPNLLPIDPTGAGDTFRAGFLHGYARGWSNQACAQLGCVMASYTIELKGTQTHKPTIKDITDRYYSTYNTHLSLI